MIAWCLVGLALFGDPIPPPSPATSSPEVASPVIGAPMGVSDARHLLARAGFGGTLEEIDRTARLTREEAVGALLDGVQTESLIPPPAFLETPLVDRAIPRGASEEERREYQRIRRQRIQQLKAWWICEMALTDSPLTERLVLFWHNHFVSESRKVNVPHFVWQQNALLREHALGNFRTFLEAVSLDAAMVIYLDTQQNNRGRPNENYARELLELFTLGEGHYTEDDIQAAARAFTGWKVDSRSGEVHLIARQHDAGEKTFFGKTGRHEVHDILDIVLDQPRAAEYIVEELWLAFVAPEPPRSEVERLARVFRDSGYELRPLYEAVLLSPGFWAEQNRGALIRSPVDLVVGTTRLLGLEGVPPESLYRAAATMGQDLFDPPNVKGWPGGDRWITSSSLLTRRQFLERATTGVQVAGRRNDRRAGSDQPKMDPGMDPGMEPTGSDRPSDRRRRRGGARPVTPAMAMLRTAWAGLGETDAERARALAERLNPLTPVIDREEGELPLTTLERLLLDPTYQLK